MIGEVGKAQETISDNVGKSEQCSGGENSGEVEKIKRWRERFSGKQGLYIKRRWKHAIVSRYI